MEKSECSIVLLNASHLPTLHQYFYYDNTTATVSLNLNANSLKGTLPTEFGLLTKLSK